MDGKRTIPMGSTDVPPVGSPGSTGVSPAAAVVDTNVSPIRIPKASATVLVVDDEAWMRDSCRQILQQEGYQVLTAEDGQTGLEIVRRQGPDLALIDLLMPGMDGIALLQAVKAIDPDIGAVVVTGYATVEKAVEAMRAGACDFLPKPFQPSDLRRVVGRGVEHRQAAVQMSSLLHDKAPPAELHLAMLAHRFKEPLAALRMCVGVVLQGYTGEINPRARQMIEVSAQRADQMLHFVDDWLTLARLERGQGIQEPRTVDIVALAAAVVERVRQQSQAEKLTVRLTAPGDSVALCGDPAALEELLCNLLDNAVRYTPPGGEVTVEVDVRGQEAVVTVRDTGPGVPPEEVDRIFEPFYRGKAQKSIPGTGLGLPIAKRIAEAHGGRIDLDTAAGKGAAFRVVLPRSVSAGCDRASPGQAAAISGPATPS
jgi:signal transduction histidine kinase